MRFESGLEAALPGWYNSGCTDLALVDVAEGRQVGAFRDVSMAMPSTAISPNDPASFAAEVRDLATQAHRMMNDPSAPASKARELSRRIDRLQSETKGMMSPDLADWLANLRRRLEPKRIMRPRVTVGR